MTAAVTGHPVEFRDAAFRFGARSVLNGLNISVATGETLVLLGRSGSGKTTALRLVNGMLLPSGGTVLVRGRPTTEWDAVQLRRSIGYVIQEGGLFPHWSVARNVGLVLELENQAAEKRSARVAELLELVGLPASEYAGRLPRELSGGQRQRVGVARALAAGASIMLFDEPFGALDPVTRMDMQDEFLRLHQTLGITSVFVTHDVREAMRLGSRIGLLDQGALVFFGTPGEFRSSTHPGARAFLRVLEADSHAS